MNCIGCGYCCTNCICIIGLTDKVTGLCKFLMWNGERYMCSIAEQYSKELRIGMGCDFPDNPYRKEMLKQKKSKSRHVKTG